MMTTTHIVASVAALGIGALVAVLPKGTRTHRWLGWCYVTATAVYAVSALQMFPSTGRLTPFHAVAVQSLVLVGGGVIAARARRRGLASWRLWHLRFMLYSYVALVVTGLRFALPYLTRGGRAAPFLIFSVLPLASWWYIERHVARRWR